MHFDQRQHLEGFFSSTTRISLKILSPHPNMGPSLSIDFRCLLRDDRKRKQICDNFFFSGSLRLSVHLHYPTISLMCPFFPDCVARVPRAQKASVPRGTERFVDDAAPERRYGELEAIGPAGRCSVAM